MAQQQRKITRQRATGVDEKAGLFGTGSKTWIWNIDTGGRDVTLEDLWKLFPDFLPGYTEAGFVVDDVDMTENGAGTDFRLVSQSWRRLETENPLEEPFRITGMESLEVMVPAYKDFDGKVLQTTAGEPLLGMTRPVKVWRFTGAKNLAGIPAWLAQYGKATNADTVRIGTVAIPPNCLQLAAVRIGDEDDSARIGGRKIIFRPMEIEFWWNPETWTTDVLNMGFYELVTYTQQPPRSEGVVALGGEPAKGKTYTIPVRMQNNGTPVDSPQFLNAEGQRFRDKDGKVKSLLKSNEIIVLHFNMFERLPFRKLMR
jgi:hypothetical protein